MSKTKLTLNDVLGDKKRKKQEHFKELEKINKKDTNKVPASLVRDNGNTEVRDNGNTEVRDNGNTGVRDNGNTGVRDNAFRDLRNYGKIPKDKIYSKQTVNLDFKRFKKIKALSVNHKFSFQDLVIYALDQLPGF